MRLGFAIFFAIAAMLAAAYLAFGSGSPSIPEGALRIDDPATHWRDFVELDPPVLLPGDRDGEGKIRDFLRLPAGASIGSEPDGTGGVRLVFPAGTVADRVEYRHGFVVDVRGTELLAGGGESFHVYRPATDQPGGPLFGFAWKRGDAAAQKAATEKLVSALEDGLGFSPGEAPPIAGRHDAAERLGHFNQCDSCHVHGRPERTFSVSEPPWPRRATDGSGFFVPGYVLRDTAPLETHRPVERNLNRPGVHFTCSGGGKPGTLPGTLMVACNDGSVPHATVDLPALLARGDPEAQGACASRMFLLGRMDAATRSHFEAAAAACQATAERVAPVVVEGASDRDLGK